MSLHIALHGPNPYGNHGKLGTWKPHIRRADLGLWSCRGGRWTAFGDSPVDSFVRWTLVSEAAAAREHHRVIFAHV